MINLKIFKNIWQISLLKDRDHTIPNPFKIWDLRSDLDPHQNMGLRTWKDRRSAKHWINPSTVTWWWIVIEYRGHRFLRRVFFNIFWSCWRWGWQSSKFNCNAKSSFWSLNWFLRSFFFYGRSLKGRWYSE